MTKSPTAPPDVSGFTLVEMSIAVMILAVLSSIAILKVESLVAKAKYSRVKADMNAIAYAGYVDYTNNLGVWDYTPLPWQPPPSITSSGQLPIWPTAPCPGWYYSWDNGAIFGLDVRVTLRRPNETPFWSYCVNTFGGGSCTGPDMFTNIKTIDISTAAVNHFTCSE